MISLTPKVLIAELTGIPEIAIPDSHPEVMELADISADELVEKLHTKCDRKFIDK